MDSNKDVLQRLRSDLLAAGITPQKIILFGSRARGDNLKTSDYDVIVISDEFKDIKFPRRLMQIEDAFKGSEAIEPLAYTKSEYSLMKQKSYVIAAAEKEGIVF